MDIGGYILKFETEEHAREAMPIISKIVNDPLEGCIGDGNWNGISNWSRFMRQERRYVFCNSEHRMLGGEHGYAEDDSLILAISRALISAFPKRTFVGRTAFEETISGYQISTEVRYDGYTLEADFYEGVLGEDFRCELDFDKRSPLSFLEENLSDELRGCLDGSSLDRCNMNCARQCGVITHSHSWEIHPKGNM